MQVGFFLLAIWCIFTRSALGATTWIGYSSLDGTQAPGWIAREAGLFAKHGLNIEFVFTAGDRAVVPLLAGDTPIITVGGLSAVASRLGSSSWPRYDAPSARRRLEFFPVFPDVIIIAQIFDRILYSLMVTPEIRSLADLRSKKLGANRFGSATELPLRVVLRENGFDPEKNMTILQMASQAEILGSLRMGAIQGGMIASPLTAAAKTLGMKELINMPSLGIVYPQTIIATTERFLRGRRDSVLRFTRAYIEGIHRYLNDREFSLNIIAKYTNAHRTNLEPMYNAHAPYLRKIPVPTPESIKRVLQELAVNDWRALGFPPEDYIDGSIITELEREGFFQRVWR
jgi:ABC-type nitrate/sulfonate/bicarbonate transport system substrate-binding protein